MGGGTLTLSGGLYQFNAGITISGGSQTYSGAVSAPDAALTMSGGTYTNTTFVGNTITVSGEELQQSTAEPKRLIPAKRSP
jgi:hypothetical protein